MSQKGCCQGNRQPTEGCQGNMENSACCGKSQQVRESVKQYYGRELQDSRDCQTGVNCLVDSQMPRHIKQALAQVHEDVSNKYFGCGPVIPEAVEGCSVLDLGSGSGRDCYALSKLVGPTGRVVGVDMTEEQLAVARSYVGYHTELFGYSQPNVEFVNGYIENLAKAGLKDDTFDIIISNCVINLSTDKESVLKEAYRVLKVGGEMYFSDVYTDTRLSESARNHRVLWGECVSGALHWQDLFRIAEQTGFSRPRLVTAKLVDVSKFKDILGDAKFVSVTYRLFKLPTETKAACAATYEGGILGKTEDFQFDHTVTFKKGENLVVDSELATLLSSSRFGKFFSFNPTETHSTISSQKVDPFSVVGEIEPGSGSGCCS